MKIPNNFLVCFLFFCLYGLSAEAQINPSIHIFSAGSNGSESIEFDGVESELEEFNDIATETFRLKQKSNQYLEISNFEGNPNRILSDLFLESDSTDIIIMGLWGGWKKSEQSIDNYMLAPKDSVMSNSALNRFMEFCAPQTSIFFIASANKYAYEVPDYFEKMEAVSAGKIVVVFESDEENELDDVISSFLDSFDESAHNEEADINNDRVLSFTEWLSFFLNNLATEEESFSLYKISDGPDHKISLLD